MINKDARKTSQKSPNLRLTSRDFGIACSVAENCCLTTEQIHFVYFPSIHRTRKRLRLLHLGGVLDRIVPPVGLEGLSHQAVYQISRHGLRLLQSQGLCQDIRPQKKVRSRPGSLLFLSHTLSRNNFRLALTRSVGSDSNVTIKGWRHDNAITKYVQIPGISGIDYLGKFPLRADAEFQMTYGDSSLHYFLEIDNGTTDLRRLTKKMIGYAKLRFTQNQNNYVGLKDMRVLVLTFSQARRDNIVKKLTIVAREQMVRPLWLIASVEQKNLIHTNILKELHWIEPSISGVRSVTLENVTGTFASRQNTDKMLYL